MDTETLKKRIEVARGARKADLVIKNCRIIDVFTPRIYEGEIAIADGVIAGVSGPYEGEEEIDAGGAYACPALIDSHIHVESSYVTPEELGRLLVPHGTSTILADPHEIVNVEGIKGLDYMLSAAKRTALDIRYLLPSCVPSTPFEHAGCTLDAAMMEEPLYRKEILGLAEFMNYPGVVNCDPEVLKKLTLAMNEDKLIDGHAPGLSGNDLMAYAAAEIHGDHECGTVEEMQEKLSLGMYILLREGSACHNLRTLLKGVTKDNARRCLLCSDDLQTKTIFEEGHIDKDLRICVQEGLDPLTAIRMATLNAAECFHLEHQGAIAPGYRADIVLFEDLRDFHAKSVFLKGVLTAEDGKYLPKVTREDITPMTGSIHLKDFSKEKLKMHLPSGHVKAIEILPGGVVTGSKVVDVDLDSEGEFVFDPKKDVCKIAVVERHQGTGNVACAFLAGYGIQKGAVAVSIAHDSHNIICAGVSDDEIAFAVREIEKIGGGMAVVEGGKVLAEMALPVGGIMSDQSGETVRDELARIHDITWENLSIHKEVEPVMTLTFMSLAVIPSLKLTDEGLFDVDSFQFTSILA
ncbi:MAG TPA: adenine deaminase [Lachnospiraceae bacterium]|jgi:adenine deaminase|nr:adenine deaminase [Lachnospiraceae bacterium]